ncbi:hemagglutinin repeat-containing protein [Gilliamella sp. B2865]|uniref:hemagglutinin repeat-containing protein n=1 Tax=Gilliamella sp. B2865 TaxID=2817984 RepID=UPI003A5CC76E|nr:hemagglutinin repeat-containing protein [Gilliamella sp. B2785]MCX8679171.1 hemagglutinin repeat-containing protein [Gilliamella sp. B2865]
MNLLKQLQKLLTLELNIKTGNDANIIAGQVKGDKVVADIGHDLNIESKQDTDHYHKKSKRQFFLGWHQHCECLNKLNKNEQ